MSKLESTTSDIRSPLIRKIRARPGTSLFLFALFLRLLWLSVFLGNAEELVKFPAIDGAFYHQWAQDILAGRGLAKEAFFAHPLYPHAIAALYALVGVEPLAVGVLQSFLGAVTCVWVFRLGSRFFNPSVAWVAGLGMAVFWPAVVDVALLETVELGNFLFVASLVLVSSKAPSWRMLVAGILLGAAALCRANLLLLGPIFVLYLIDSASWRLRFTRALGFTVGVCLVFFSVGVRNRVVAHEWLFLTGHAGITLYSGFAPGNVTGTYQAPRFVRPEPKFEQRDFQAEAERRVGHVLSATQSSNYWRTQALNSISSDPKGAIRRVIKKLGLILGAYEVSDNYNLSYLRGLTPFRFMPLCGWGFIVTMATIGFAVSWHRRRELFLLYGCVVLYVATLLVFFVSSRLRAPLWPLLMPFAAAGVMRLWTWYRLRRFAVFAMEGAVAFILWVVLQSMVPAFMKQSELGQAWATHAHAFAQNGDLTNAATLQGKALTIEKRNPYLLVNAGQLSSRTGDPSRAVSVCSQAIALSPRLASAYVCRGVAQAQLGNLAAAVKDLRFAVVLDPKAIGPRLNLVIALGRSGADVEARALLSDLARESPNDPEVRSILKAVDPSQP